MLSELAETCINHEAETAHAWDPLATCARRLGELAGDSPVCRHWNTAAQIGAMAVALRPLDERIVMVTKLRDESEDRGRPDLAKSRTSKARE
jgi:hypothetical protein